MKHRANREWFKAEVVRRLLELGATADNCNCGSYEYVLDTIAGPLFITPFDDWIACRFERVSEVNNFRHSIHGTVTDTRFNSVSGKWNHVYADEFFLTKRDTRIAADRFFFELDNYLPVEV